MDDREMTMGGTEPGDIEPVELSTEPNARNVARLRRPLAIVCAVLVLTTVLTLAGTRASARPHHPRAVATLDAPETTTEAPLLSSTTDSTTTLPRPTTTLAAVNTGTAEPSSTPTAAPTPSPPTEAPADAPPSSNEPTTTTAEPSTTTTSLDCHDSTDPACGPFHYDPPLTNQPATVTIDTTTPQRDTNGEWYVFFVMHINDPDSATWGVFATGYQLEPGNGSGGSLCGYTDFGTGWDATGTGNLSPGACMFPATCPDQPTNRYGAWTPPPLHPSHDALLTAWFDYPDTPQPKTYTAILKALLDPCGPRPTIATGSVDVVIP